MWQHKQLSTIFWARRKGAFIKDVGNLLGGSQNGFKFHWYSPMSKIKTYFMAGPQASITLTTRGRNGIQKYMKSNLPNRAKQNYRLFSSTCRMLMRLHNFFGHTVWSCRLQKGSDYNILSEYHGTYFHIFMVKYFLPSVYIKVHFLTLFLPGEGGISPLIVYHVTKSVRNRVKPRLARKTISFV